MTAVSVTLNQVTRSCARSSSNHRALLPAEQASPHRTGDSTDNGALRLAVVMSVGPLVRHAIHHSGQHNKNKHQQHRNYVLLSDTLYH
jgi:hypothetical protein